MITIMEFIVLETSWQLCATFLLLNHGETDIVEHFFTDERSNQHLPPHVGDVVCKHYVRHTRQGSGTVVRE